MFGIIDSAVDWVTEAAGGIFDYASTGISDLFSTSSSDVAKIFSKGTFDDIVSILGGKGGTAGAASNILALLRGGLGAYTDIARSEFLQEKYLNDARTYQEQLDLLGIETPLQISKIQNEMGWATTSAAIRTQQSELESKFTSQVASLRDDQLGDRIDGLLAQREAENAIFPLRQASLDVQAKGIRDTLDVRTRILRGDIDAVLGSTDLDLKGLENQKAIIGEVAEFEAGTRRLQMVREVAQNWITQAHYGVMTGVGSSSGNAPTWARMMGEREIKQIEKIAGMRMAGIDIAADKVRLQRDNAVRQGEGQLELLNVAAGTQLAGLDLDKLIIAAQQRAAAAGTDAQVSALQGDREILKAQTAYSLAKGVFDRNMIEAQLTAQLGSSEIDLDLLNARAESRGRMLSLQIEGAFNLAGMAESQGDIALLARGADMLLGPGLNIASSLWGKSSAKTAAVAGLTGSGDYGGVLGEYADVGGLGTE